jgi:cytochrome c oxidase cbb3-type subunit 3
MTHCVSLESHSPWLGARARARRLAGLGAVLVAVLVCACERAPAADSLPEWTQADHHSTDDGRLASGMQAPGPAAKGAAGGDNGGAGAGGKASEVDQLVELTWRQQCTTCHGPLGHGDGQMGPMVQAPDLTLGDWQSKISDAEMATLIKMGRNRMPAFNLPDPVLAGLVTRIRSLKAR